MAEEHRRPALTTMVARRVIVAVTTGGFAYLVSELAGQQPISGLILAILIGAVVLLTQLLIDFDDRIHGIHQWQLNQSHDHEAAQLLRAVDNCGLDTRVVVDLLAKAALVGNDVADVVRAFAEYQICQTAELLEELGKGKASYEDGEDHDWILGLTRVTRRSIDAISTTTVDGSGSGFAKGFWASDHGKRYLKLQAEVIQAHGVSVRRLFILEKPGDLTDSDFLTIVQSQTAAGIEVMTIHLDQVPEVFLQGRLDVIIYDDAIAYELLPAPSASPHRGYLFTNLIAKDQHVLERRNIFNALWSLAERLQRGEPVA